MKKFIVLTLIVLIAGSLSPVITYADDPLQVEIKPIPLQIHSPSEQQGECVLVPTAENPPMKYFSSVDIIYLEHSYRLYEFQELGIKCRARFSFPTLVMQQTNTCPVIENVYVRGDLAEAMCATLASALGSDFPRFNLIIVKETKEGLELQDLVWHRKPPECRCQQCPQCPEGSQDSEDQSDSGGELRELRRSKGPPSGFENLVNPD